MDPRGWEEFYIIHQDSGQAIFHQSYSAHKYDPDLFAGLLSAILAYAAAYSKEEIAELEMNEKVIKMLKVPSHGVLFVYIIDSKSAMNKRKIKKILKNLKKEFENMFSPDQIRNWNGNVAIFSGFKQVLDEHLRPWKHFENVTF